MQDALGDWHDWLTLTQTASKHLGDVRESPLVAELHNVTGAKFRHAVAVLSHDADQTASCSEPARDPPARSTQPEAGRPTAQRLESLGSKSPAVALSSVYFA